MANDLEVYTTSYASLGCYLVLWQIEVNSVLFNIKANFSDGFAVVDGFDRLDGASKRHCELDVIIHGFGENVGRHKLEVVEASLTWIIGRDCDDRSWVLSYETGKSCCLQES